MYGPTSTHTREAAAYTGVLGWPIATGHRFRPRGGCTCAASVTCSTPGAHPSPGPIEPKAAEQLIQALDMSPGASLIAPALLFDVIVLPKTHGMAAMMSLDRVAAVPCLIDVRRAMLFVLPSTARYAIDADARPQVELRSGPGAWVALPPSHGVRWDTPPWHEPTSRPVPLLHGRDLRKHLDDALRVVVPQGAASEATQPR